MYCTKKQQFCNALLESIHVELSRDRGYGCVTYKTNGSHNDMNFNTFLKSAQSISNSIKQIKSQDLENFLSLRNFGVFVENEMFNATNGINTHKGLIFLTLFILRTFLINENFNNLKKSISEFSKDLAKDYIHPKNSAILKKNGINDIRSFPLNGYEFILNFIDKIEKNPSYWTEDKKTLYLISTIDDTTTIKRSDIDTLRILQKHSEKAFYSKDEELAKKLDEYYIKNKISSGGVADILTITNILLKIKGDFK